MANGVIDSISEHIKYAVENPFGLDFVNHNGRIYIPLGSAINCIGYNDYLEKVVGVTRFAIGALALAVIATSKESESRKREAMVATAHCLRGVLEAMGTFEHYLLLADVMMTVYNLSSRYLSQDPKSDNITAPANQ